MELFFIPSANCCLQVYGTTNTWIFVCWLSITKTCCTDISFHSFLGFLRIFYAQDYVMLPVSRDGFTSAFMIYMPFPFFCLIALARTSNRRLNRTLNRSGESRHPCFVSYFGGKVLSLFTVKYDFVGFSWMPFRRLRKFPSTCLLIVFHLKIHCILSNSYSTSIDTIMWIFFLCSV